MPPIKESTQQTVGASAPLDLPTQSDEVDPGLEQVNATACISGAGAANTARCGWETQMENRMSATEQAMSAIEQGMSATEQAMSATEQATSAIEQCMCAAEQGMTGAEQGMSATEQRMSAAEQGISATGQRMRATEQLGRETRRELGDIRELLQAPCRMQQMLLLRPHRAVRKLPWPLSIQIDEARDETGKRSTQWVRALKGFCETTTFHGLQNVAESTSNSVRRLVTAAEKGTYRWLDDLYKEQIISTFNYTKWGVGNQSMRDVYLQHALRKEDMIASDNFLELNVYMRDLRVQEYEQLEAYTLIDLLSDIGGSMGLLIGTSVITIFEAVDAFVFTLTSWQPRKKRRQRRSLKKYMDNYEL